MSYKLKSFVVFFKVLIHVTISITPAKIKTQPTASIQNFINKSRSHIISHDTFDACAPYKTTHSSI